MNFKQKLNDMQKDFGGLPFWSWNDRLNPDELRRQMRVMKELGMNGFFMHARGGLETEYLSDEWYDCIKACVDEAKNLDMEAWSYDENGWPSGFAGGKVLENPWNLATYLKLETLAEFPEITENRPPERRVLAVFVKEDNTYKYVKEACGANEYFVIYQNYDSSYVDAMDADVIKEFIKFTHEDYKAKLGDDFGTKFMPGFFTDEPQYYRWATPWSNKMPEEFLNHYGYSVFDKLIALFVDFDGADEFRYDYWKLAHNLFMNNFVKQIYDWCEANGCKITGHAIEESALFTQMWCCGGIMPFYEYEHIPGMDYLGRNVNDDLGPKQLGSVAAQLRKKKVLTETFACCGWDVTPAELKRIADLQYASGVNTMCHHLYAYSIRGQRKRDYPANYSEHLPWQEQFGDFVKYYNRLGALLSEGDENVNTLIIHPIHSDWLTYKREVDGASVEEIENGVHKIVCDFSDNQIPYHFGDETLMAKYAKVDGNKLIVGKMSYDFVVLPKIFTIDKSTACLLKDFIANGGKVFLYDGAPTRIDGRTADLSWLKSNVTFDEIKANANVHVLENGKSIAGIKTMTRTTDYGKIYYLTNVYNESHPDVKIEIPGAKSVKEIFIEQGDFESGNIIKSCDFVKNDNGIIINTSFEPSKSRIFIDDYKESIGEPEGVTARVTADSKDVVTINRPFNVSEFTDNSLTLDYAMISLDGGKTYQKPKPVIQIFDELLRMRFKGELFIKYVFDMKKKPSKLFCAVEPMKFKSFKVNCANVEFTDGFYLDRSFKIADILPWCATGRNVIDMSFDYYQNDYVYEVLYGNVMESLRNCLNFDTEVESIYLFGDFGVLTEGAFEPSERSSFIYNDKFAITEAPKTVKGENIITEGFPFFAGKITLDNKFNSEDLPENPELIVDGRFAYADVYVNGQFVKRLMFTNHCDIADFVKSGENDLRIVIGNSNRNLLGPHHYADPEPYAVGPTTFSLENMWHDGKCDAFADRYSFVKFGIRAGFFGK